MIWKNLAHLLWNICLVTFLFWSQLSVSRFSLFFSSDYRAFDCNIQTQNCKWRFNQNNLCSLNLYFLSWNTVTHHSICHHKWCLTLHSILLTSLQDISSHMTIVKQFFFNQSKICDSSFNETTVSLNIFPTRHLLQADWIDKMKRCKKWNTSFLYKPNTSFIEMTTVALKFFEGYLTLFL